jgi:UDP-N-acetylglucosamine 2-epimerase (non-hydrolysing)
VLAVTVAGARPNFMKVAPVHRAMLGAGTFSHTFIHTGQHYDWEMSEVFLRELGLPPPDFELGVGSGSHATQTAQVMMKLEPILERLQPDVVIVVGDVNSTLAAALTAVKLEIPVAHIEAGLRSLDRTMPEEINRIVTDSISDILFAPSPEGVENLRREGNSDEKIHFVGNVMIDTLDALFPKALRSDVLQRLQLGERSYLLVTLHRPSNVDTAASLDVVTRVIAGVAKSLPTVFVAHPRTRRRLEKTGLSARLEGGGVRTIDPVGYLDFLRLESAAAAVLTDSGGIQEETTVLGVPCLTLRENTERPITVTQGTNRLVGLDIERIVSAVKEIVTAPRPPGSRPDLWDGHAADRIVSVLERTFGVAQDR